MTRISTLDIPSINRATVGFDKLFDQMDRAFSNSKQVSYPPYNVVSLGENRWEVSIAVAGFTMEELEIVVDRNVLTIDGAPAKTEDENVTYLHRGIANRSFRRQFTLADYVEVESATLNLGVLTVRLVRNVPEALQPRKIEINTTRPAIEN